MSDRTLPISKAEATIRQQALPQPIAELLGPLSQVRIRSSRFSSTNLREERFTAQQSNRLRSTGQCIDLHADRHVKNTIDMHPRTTALVTSLTRYTEPPALPGPSTATGVAEENPPKDPEELRIKARPGFRWK